MTEEPIADAVNQFWLKRGYVASCVAVLTIWFAFFHPENPFQIFEQPSFSWLYALLFTLVVALMLSSGFRMAQIWMELHRLLVELERRPIRSAFSRFKGMTWSFWRQGGEEAEWAYMVRSLETVAQLEGGGRTRESGLPPASDFQVKILALVKNSETILETLRVGGTPDSVQADLTRLNLDIRILEHTLESGAGNLFLRSTLHEAGAVSKSAVRLITTSATLVAKGGTALDPAVLRSHVEILPDKLKAAVNVVELAQLSAGAQDSTGLIWSVWQSLQKDRPWLPAVNSLWEYRRAARLSGNTNEAAETTANHSVLPRVVRFHELETRFRDLQVSLANVLRKAWAVLDDRQAAETLTLTTPEERHEAKDPATLTSEARQLNVLEEFVALRYVTFIRGVLGHLRHVMIFLALSFSLALISLSTYSFEPHQSLIWSFTLIFVVTGFLVVGVLMQLHRDPILSRVTGTSGNVLDLHFYLRIVSFGAIPLLTLLATHYPSIGRYLVSFLQPSLEALK